MKKKMVVIYMEDLSNENIDKLAGYLGDWLRKHLPETAFFISNKKLELLSLKDVLPWLKRLVKEVEEGPRKECPKCKAQVYVTYKRAGAVPNHPDILVVEPVYSPAVIAESGDYVCRACGNRWPIGEAEA